VVDDAESRKKVVFGEMKIVEKISKELNKPRAFLAAGALLITALAVLVTMFPWFWQADIYPYWLGVVPMWLMAGGAWLLVWLNRFNNLNK